MDFPKDVLQEIFSYLNLPDLLFAARTCLTWYLVAKSFLDKANDDISIFNDLLMRYKNNILVVNNTTYDFTAINLGEMAKITGWAEPNNGYKYNIGFITGHSIEIFNIDHETIWISNKVPESWWGKYTKKGQSFIEYFIFCLKRTLKSLDDIS